MKRLTTLLLAALLAVLMLPAQAETVACYDHGHGTNAHGYISNGGKNGAAEHVILKPYGASWVGDRYESLTIKSVHNWDGSGKVKTVTYDLPVAGEKYFGAERNVIKWTVCKGTTPQTTTTTVPPTTTTVPETTTTTVPETTTTTVPEVTTSTTQPETTTTTQPVTTTTVPEEPSSTTTTQPPTSTTSSSSTTSTVPSPTSSTVPAPTTTAPTPSPETLPETGIESDHLAIVALVALAAGAALVGVSRKAEES